jgi:hypothetical protein
VPLSQQTLLGEKEREHMKKNIIQIGLAGVALAAGLSLTTQTTLAAGTSKTLTGQSIMANLYAEGTFAIVQTDTYHYNLDAAAELFSNAWDENAPAESCGSNTSGPTTTIEATNPGVQSPCDPTVTPPAMPAPDATKLKRDDHPGKNDVVGDNQCALLDGAPLTGLTYTQSASASAQCTYVSDVSAITNGPNAGKYRVTRRTITKTCDDTWTYDITPLQVSYPPLTAWDFVGSTGGDSALVSVNAIIAGESVVSSKQHPLKYSFSIGGDVDPRVSRVQNLAISVNNVVVANPGSTVVKNTPGSAATPTVDFGEVVLGSDGALDFYYDGNAGSNGHTELLNQPEDARTILNTDSFSGNNDGGADGSALAAAFMDQVDLNLTEGDYTVTLTGTVKDNAGLADLPINVNKTVHIVHPGCGNN